jgi:hypothetical protein
MMYFISGATLKESMEVRDSMRRKVMRYIVEYKSVIATVPVPKP